MDKLLLIGVGGHFLTVVESLTCGIFSGIGAVDEEKAVGQCVLGIKIVGRDCDLERLRHHYNAAFVSLGSIGSWQRRKEILDILDRTDFKIPTIIHPAAIVSPSADISRGTLVGSGAIVNALSSVGQMCILNSGCVVEHECKVSPYTHIASRAVLCGSVSVGKGTHIGANSVVIQGITIGENTIVGAGSVVTRNLPSGVVAYGNPCRVIREKE